MPAAVRNLSSARWRVLAALAAAAVLTWAASRDRIAEAHVIAAPSHARACGVYEPRPPEGTASFSVAVGQDLVAHRLISAFVLPGERLELRAIGRGGFRAEAGSGSLAPAGESGWRWTAPEEPGSHCLRIRSTERGDDVTIRAFVMTPYDGSASFKGYRIGQYAAGTDPAYRRPPGFVEVTDALRDTWISPHFRLGQFLCKQDGPSRWVALQTRLLLKLERLLERANARGIRAATFHVMSGYRTPFYNRSIGNTTTYSRHLYGDAADIFVDEDGDGRMDDLDGDGRVTVGDARILYDLVEEMQAELTEPSLVGGVGLYGPAPHRGPFVHVDTRGKRARW